MGYSILVTPRDSPDADPFIVIDSPESASGKDWTATPGSTSPDPHANLLKSVSSDGDTLTAVVDVDGHDNVLGDDQFEADISVVMIITGESPAEPVMLKAQECAWNHEMSSTASVQPPILVPEQADPGSTRSTAVSGLPSGHKRTIADFIRENGINETAVKRGDAGAPNLDLPFPPGWQDAASRTPDNAFGAIMSTDSPGATPATIVAIFSKLTCNVDVAKLLEYAPGEIQNLPGYVGPETGTPTTLGGFNAVSIGGSYMKDGVKRIVAQKTVVIPGQGGVYLLQLNADGTPAQQSSLETATTVIDEKTVIRP